MKKIFTILAAVLITASVFSQSPERISYQAVVRDGSNNLVSSAAIGMQISILQGSVSGTSVYTETQIPTSNANGLVSLEIGAGTIVSGNFTAIDWANGPYFIKTETDPSGGTSYTITGTSQLLSVPYALHAKTAESLIGSNTPKKYGLEYFSGDGQKYGGGGMPYPMVFKIFNITDNIYVTSLIDEGLTLVSTGNIGFEDSSFYRSNDDCGQEGNPCFTGYYYIPGNVPGNDLPLKPFNLIVTVTLKYANTNEVIDRYIINQYIQ